MELARHKEPVLGDLHRFHDPAVGGGAAEDHAGSFHGFPVVVVELIAVAVALGDQLLAVALHHLGAGLDLAGIAAQPKGAALVDVLVLVGHEVDDLVQAVLVKLAGVGVLNAAHVPAELDHSDLHPQADAQVGHVVFPGVFAGQDHALNAPAAKPAGDDDAVDAPQPGSDVLGGEVLGIHPVDLHFGAVVIPGVAQGFHHREVGVVELHILAHQGDVHLLFPVADLLHHLQPFGHIRLGGFQAQLPADDVGKVVLLQHDGRLVQHRDGQVFNDAVGAHIAEQGNFLENALVGDRLVGAQHDDVRLDAHGLQLFDGVLGGLGLVLPRAFQVGHQGDVDEQAVLLPHLLGHLADGLQKGLALNVAGRAADLGDDHIRVGLLPHAVDEVLDLAGDVGDHLDSFPQVLPTALLVEHIPIHLAGGQVGKLVQIFIDEPLVMAQVQIGFQPVLGDIHLPVLVGAHRAGVYVDIGVQLLGGYFQPPSFQEAPQRRRCDPLTQSGNHASGDKNILGQLLLPPVKSSQCLQTP